MCTNPQAKGYALIQFNTLPRLVSCFFVVLALACARTVAMNAEDAATPNAPVAEAAVPDTACSLPSSGPLHTPTFTTDSILDVDEDIGIGCVLRGDGHVRCRGYGFNGTRGDGTSERSIAEQFAITVIPGLDDVRSFDVSAYVGCAARGDGTVWCWGDNLTAHVHVDLPRAILRPTRIPGVEGAVKVVIGHLGIQACAVLADGHARCWGGTSANAPIPDDEGQAADMVLTPGSYTACILYRGDRGRCLGRNFPELTWPAGAVRQFSGRSSSSCVLVAEGTVSCWGYLTGTTFSPPQDMGVRCATSLASGGSHSCVALTDGTVNCFGQSFRGNLGVPEDGRMGPVRVQGIDRVVQVLRSGSSSCARREDGSVWCWGAGFLAQGLDRPTVPVRIDW